MSRHRYRAQRGIGVSSLLFASLAVAGTTAATSTTEPEPAEDLATASTSAATVEAFAGWTQYKGNAGHSGVTDAGPTEPVELWRFEDGRTCHRQPAIVDGVVYAACHNGYLYALDAATGEQLWRYSHVDFGNVVAVGELVYADVLDPRSSGDVETNVLRAFDAATGEVRWEAPVAGSTGPVVDHGVLVVGTVEGLMLGFDATTGAERWRYQVTTTGGVDPVALADGIAYAGVDGEGFFAVDAESGTLLWRGDTAGQQIGTAAVAEGVAYIGATPGGGGGHLYAFDAKTGELLWAGEPLFAPTVLDGVGYSGFEGGTITAFDTADGTALWHAELGGGIASASAIADGVLYALHGPSETEQVDSAVVALDAATGEQLWSFTVGSEALNGPAVAGGIAIGGTDHTGIYAIGGTDQGAVAPTTSP